MTPGVAAAIFYVSVAALVAGGIRAVRASVERKAQDRVGLVLAAIGCVGLVVAILAFVTGPKTLLPF